MGALTAAAVFCHENPPSLAARTNSAIASRSLGVVRPVLRAADRARESRSSPVRTRSAARDASRGARGRSGRRGEFTIGLLRLSMQHAKLSSFCQRSARALAPCRARPLLLRSLGAPATYYSIPPKARSQSFVCISTPQNWHTRANQDTACGTWQRYHKEPAYPLPVDGFGKMFAGDEPHAGVTK